MEAEAEDSNSQASLGYIVTPYLKKKKKESIPQLSNHSKILNVQF
jgi:hypothetical protein